MLPQNGNLSDIFVTDVGCSSKAHGSKGQLWGKRGCRGLGKHIYCANSSVVRLTEGKQELKGFHSWFLR
jgi:hypothetical protein